MTVRKVQPDPLVQTVKSDPKARRVRRAIPAARKVRPARRVRMEMTALLVLKARKAQRAK